MTQANFISHPQLADPAKGKEGKTQEVPATTFVAGISFLLFFPPFPTHCSFPFYSGPPLAAFYPRWVKKINKLLDSMGPEVS